MGDHANDGSSGQATTHVDCKLSQLLNSLGRFQSANVNAERRLRPEIQIGPETTWCERGDSNPHGFTRQILSSARTKNQRLRQQTTICYVLLQMPCPARLSSDAAIIHPTRSGLVVGTKLGTGDAEGRAGLGPASPTQQLHAGRGSVASCPAARGQGARRRHSASWHTLSEFFIFYFLLP